MVKAVIDIVAKDNASGTLKNTSSNLDKMGTTATNASANMVTAFNQAAQAMGALGDSIVNATGEMVNGFAGFDQAMTNTKSILGASEVDMERLNAKAKEMGETMPISMQEAAEGFYALASAGQDTNEVLDNTSIIAKAAIAGASDFGTAAKLTTSLLGAFSEQGVTATRILDVMMTTVKKGMTTFNELADTFPFVASTASSAGVSLEDLGASIDQIRNAGIGASMTGTTLAQVITNLAAPTEEGLAAMEKYGLTLKENADGGLDLVNTFVGMSEQLSVLAPGLERTSVLQDLFGKRGARAADAMLKNTDALIDNRKAMDEAGTVTTAYDIQLEGAGNQLELLAGRLENAKVALGENLLPAQVAVNEANVWFFESLANLNPALVKYGGALLIIAGNIFKTIAPMLQMISSLIMLNTLKKLAAQNETAHTSATILNTIATKAAAAATWLWNAALSANPILLLVVAVVALTAAMSFLATKLFDVGISAEDAAAAVSEVGTDEQQEKHARLTKGLNSLNTALREAQQEYSNLSAWINQLNGSIDENSTKVRENEIEIRTIELTAEQEKRALTTREEKRIIKLKLTNKELRLEMDKLTLTRKKANAQLETSNKLIEKNTRLKEENLKETAKIEIGAVIKKKTGGLGPGEELANVLLGSKQKGGPIDQTGLYLLHAGEFVVPPKGHGSNTSTSNDNRTITDNRKFQPRIIINNQGGALDDNVQGRRSAERMNRQIARTLGVQ